MSRWVDEACMHGSGVGREGGVFLDSSKGVLCAAISLRDSETGNRTQKQSSLFISWKAEEQVFQSHSLTRRCITTHTHCFSVKKEKFGLKLQFLLIILVFLHIKFYFFTFLYCSRSILSSLSPSVKVSSGCKEMKGGGVG